MTLVENLLGLFKPHLTLEQFAIAITSDVRLAIIMDLGLVPGGKNFERIKRRVSDRLDRLVSEGSLTWHLEKLTDNGILEETPVLDYTIWGLTSIGREAFKVLEKVEREMEEVKA